MGRSKKHKTHGNRVGILPRMRPLLAAAALSLSLSGCASFWDDITAHSPQGGFGNDLNYRMNLIFFSRQDPIQVLAESQDGDLRRRAYLALKYDGDAQKKELVARLLIEGAKDDKDLICRLAAVERLAEIPEPRASQALVDAFYAPANVGEKNPVVRVAAVKSLGKRKEPQGLQLLGEALVRDPSTEVRVAAARALSDYRDGSSTEVLVRALREEKDLAVRYEATASLQKITGRDLPANAAEWEQHLQSPQPPDRSLTREPLNYLKQVGWW